MTSWEIEYLIACQVSLDDVCPSVWVMTCIKLLNGPLPIRLLVNSPSVGTNRWWLLHEGCEGSSVVVGRHNE